MFMKTAPKICVFLWLLMTLSVAAQSQRHLHYPWPTAHGLLGATYGNSRFVAIERYIRENGYTVLISEDGIKWTKHPGFTGQVSYLIVANGKFYSVEQSYGEFQVFKL